MNESIVFFCGTKTFWKSRSSLNLVFIYHKKMACVEIIPLCVPAGNEYERIYTNYDLICAKLDPEEVKIYSAKIPELSSEENKSVMLEEIKLNLVQQYLYARVSLLSESDHFYGQEVFLQPAVRDKIVQADDGTSMLDILCIKPEGLIPYIITASFQPYPTKGSPPKSPNSPSSPKQTFGNLFQSFRHNSDEPSELMIAFNDSLKITREIYNVKNTPKNSTKIAKEVSNVILFDQNQLQMASDSSSIKSIGGKKGSFDDIIVIENFKRLELAEASAVITPVVEKLFSEETIDATLSPSTAAKFRKFLKENSIADMDNDNNSNKNSNKYIISSKNNSSSSSNNMHIKGDNNGNLSPSSNTFNNTNKNNAFSKASDASYKVQVARKSALQTSNSLQNNLNINNNSNNSNNNDNNNSNNNSNTIDNTSSNSTTNETAPATTGRLLGKKRISGGLKGSFDDNTLFERQFATTSIAEYEEKEVEEEVLPRIKENFLSKIGVSLFSRSNSNGTKNSSKNNSSSNLNSTSGENAGSIGRPPIDYSGVTASPKKKPILSSLNLSNLSIFSGTAGSSRTPTANGNGTITPSGLINNHLLGFSRGNSVQNSAHNSKANSTTNSMPNSISNSIANSKTTSPVVSPIGTPRSLIPRTLSPLSFTAESPKIMPKSYSPLPNIITSVVKNDNNSNNNNSGNINNNNDNVNYSNNNNNTTTAAMTDDVTNILSNSTTTSPRMYISDSIIIDPQSGRLISSRDSSPARRDNTNSSNSPKIHNINSNKSNNINIKISPKNTITGCDISGTNSGINSNNSSRATSPINVNRTDSHSRRILRNTTGSPLSTLTKQYNTVSNQPSENNNTNVNINSNSNSNNNINSSIDKINLTDCTTLPRMCITDSIIIDPQSGRLISRPNSPRQSMAKSPTNAYLLLNGIGVNNDSNNNSGDNNSSNNNIAGNSEIPDPARLYSALSQSSIGVNSRSNSSMNINNVRVVLPQNSLNNLYQNLNLGLNGSNDNIQYGGPKSPILSPCTSPLMSREPSMRQGMSREPSMRQMLSGDSSMRHNGTGATSSPTYALLRSNLSNRDLMMQNGTHENHIHGLRLARKTGSFRHGHSSRQNSIVAGGHIATMKSLRVASTDGNTEVSGAADSTTNSTTNDNSDSAISSTNTNSNSNGNSAVSNTPNVNSDVNDINIKNDSTATDKTAQVENESR